LVAALPLLVLAAPINEPKASVESLTAPIDPSDPCATTNCSGAHGTCLAGSCVCHTHWRGANCEEQACPRACSGHGSCLHGTCYCSHGWVGVDCSVPEVRCAHDCSGRGHGCIGGRCLHWRAHRAGRLTTAACRATSVLAPRVAITTASARVVRACATRASGAPSASSCCARTTATIEAIARRPGDACATAVGAERAARSAAAARASCGRMGAGTCAPDMGRAMSTVCANATLGGRDSAARRERVGILTLRDLDSAPRPESTSRLSQLFTITNGPVSGLIRAGLFTLILCAALKCARPPARPDP
jgi:hypothetical protein